MLNTNTMCCHSPKTYFWDVGGSRKVLEQHGRFFCFSLLSVADTTEDRFLVCFADLAIKDDSDRCSNVALLIDCLTDDALFLVSSPEKTAFAVKQFQFCSAISWPFRWLLGGDCFNKNVDDNNTVFLDHIVTIGLN